MKAELYWNRHADRNRDIFDKVVVDGRTCRDVGEEYGLSADRIRRITIEAAAPHSIRGLRRRFRIIG
jgi:DNA-directed RNA polymerase sigma subunit (sigma70/sigma32)